MNHRGCFLENIKFSSNLSEIYIERNKKLITQVITLGTKRTKSVLGDTPPLNFQIRKAQPLEDLPH